MKLQLNSKEALDRLIGGDSELEMHIRNNIVQEFTKKHLKALTETDLMKQSIKDITNAIERETTQYFGEYKGNWNRELQLKQEIKDMINNHISYWVENQIGKKVREEVDKVINLDVRIEKAVQSKIDYINSNYFNDQVNKEVERRIKQIKEQL